MRHIIVSKFGNEPDIFGNDLRHGMIGDWEVTKLLKVLSDDSSNFVTYFGKAKWDEKKAVNYFKNFVQYIDGEDTTAFDQIALMTDIAEFHILLGPHSYYNGGKNLPAWESIKTSIVTDRLLKRVAPQIKLMNKFPNAKLFFYMTDRRFLLQAADIENFPKIIYGQNLKSEIYTAMHYPTDDYSNLSPIHVTVEPFRFDSIWLYDKDFEEYKSNLTEEGRDINLLIAANQVTSDAEIAHSRFDKIKDYVSYLDNYTICGKWTHPDAVEFFENTSLDKHFLEGLGVEEYNKALRRSKFALVTFNTDDGPEIFDNNYLTPKYWECVYNGCLTFVERKEKPIPFIPEELQVRNGKELSDKIKRVLSDENYRLLLSMLQVSLVDQEYFNGDYFNNFFKRKRER